MTNREPRAGELTFIQDLFDREAQQQDELERLWEWLEARKAVKRVAVAQWYCRQRSCLMATAVKVQDRVIVRTARYRLSDKELEAESVEAARIENASQNRQGNLYWHARTVLINPGWTDMPWSLDLRCAHAKQYVSAGDVLGLAADNEPGKPQKIRV